MAMIVIPNIGPKENLPFAHIIVLEYISSIEIFKIIIFLKAISQSYKTKRNKEKKGFFLFVFLSS
jgi:hypothetical protein